MSEVSVTGHQYDIHYDILQINHSAPGKQTYSWANPYGNAGWVDGLCHGRKNCNITEDIHTSSP